MDDVKSFRLSADPQFIDSCNKLVEADQTWGPNKYAASARIDYMSGALYLSAAGVIVAQVQFDRRSSIERGYEAALVRNGMTLCSLDMWRKGDGWDMRIYLDRASLG